MARNTIEKDDLVKMLKKHVKYPDEEKFMASEMDDLVEHFHLLLTDMASQCPHITGNFLHSAVSMAYEMKSWRCKLFADRLHDALAYCKGKKKSMTTGKKLSPLVHKVALAFSSDQVEATSAPLPLAKGSSSPLDSPDDVEHGSRKRVRSKSRWGKETADAAASPTTPPTTREQILKMYGENDPMPSRGRQLTRAISIASSPATVKDSPIAAGGEERS